MLSGHPFSQNHHISQEELNAELASRRKEGKLGMVGGGKESKLGRDEHRLVNWRVQAG